MGLISHDSHSLVTAPWGLTTAPDSPLLHLPRAKPISARSRAPKPGLAPPPPHPTRRTLTPRGGVRDRHPRSTSKRLTSPFSWWSKHPSEGGAPPLAPLCTSVPPLHQVRGSGQPPSSPLQPSERLLNTRLLKALSLAWLPCTPPARPSSTITGP